MHSSQDAWQICMLLTKFFNCTGYILLNEMGRVAWMVNKQELCFPNSFSPQVFVTKMLCTTRFSILYATTCTNHPTHLDVMTPTICAYHHHTPKQPSWDGDSRSAAQELSCLLSKGSLLCYHELPTQPYPQQTNPVHTITLHFLKLHCNTTLPTFIRSPYWCLPFMISD